MSRGGAGCTNGLLLTVGWLLLAGLQSACGMNVTAAQDPGLAREGEGENEGEEETETESEAENEAQPVPEEDGVGIREVILTNGCPGGESKCIVRVEECRGPVDCGWGRPVSESLESVRLACVHTSPVNRFKYMWKLLRPDQQPIILANDSAILEVHREVHPLVFEGAVKSFWGEKASTTEIQSELSSTRYKDSTSLDQSPTEIPGNEDDALNNVKRSSLKKKKKKKEEEEKEKEKEKERRGEGEGEEEALKQGTPQSGTDHIQPPAS
ncbi:hypothetical protein GH733_000566 [Mirounga leonina]|nr:hypothetical protein GH733_000566 [Mirounga leonina]